MFPELQTERLLLKEIDARDQPFVFEGLSHPQVIPFYGVQYKTLEATKEQMDWYRNLQETGTGVAWKIVSKDTGKAMGVVCIYLYKPEHNKAEIGLWLLPAYWGRGYAREAFDSAVQYWKNEKKLHRVEGFIEEGNEASKNLVESAGFSYEGTMKDCEIKNGNYISLMIYAKILD